jgi:antitoxin HicB
LRHLIRSDFAFVRAFLCAEPVILAQRHPSATRVYRPAKAGAGINIYVEFNIYVDHVMIVTSQELKKYLAAKGCTFETHKGGSGHLTVRRGSRKTQLPARVWQRTRYWAGQQDFEGPWTEMTLGYRIKIEPDDNGTLLVTCPALPEVTTFGEDETEAVLRASEAISEALAARIADGGDIPDGNVRGPHLVRLPMLTALKAELYRQMRRQGVARAELARRLQWSRESVDRLFRLDHASRLDQIEAAFAAIGRRLDVEIRAA